MKHFRFTNNRSKVAGIVAINATVLLLAVSFVPRTATGSFDLEGLNQQVQNQDERLNNHEARIGNTEKDVQNLQDSTNTAPASGKAAVPTVTTQPAAQSAPAAPAPTPAPAPLTWIYDGDAYHLASDPDNCYQGRLWSDGHKDLIGPYTRMVPGLDKCMLVK